VVNDFINTAPDKTPAFYLEPESMYSRKAFSLVLEGGIMAGKAAQ
jgi:hypothetical protein|tara:strand:- start:168 stop:302 length:135 start_codon:yes stop_codon:yes gene_type:complete